MPDPERPGAPMDLFDDDDPITITEVRGTVARFEMVVDPNAGPVHFGVPARSYLPAAVFATVAVSLLGVCLYARAYTLDGPLYEHLVEGDRFRALSAVQVATFVVACAAATVLRTALEGVTVDGDAVAVKTVVGLGIPRVRTIAWVQVDRLVVTEDSALLELWDGTFERLPTVADGAGLVQALTARALERGRDVTRLPALRRVRDPFRA